MKRIFLPVLLLVLIFFCDVVTGTGVEETTMPRAQMGLDYALERLISFIPREVWTFVRNNLLSIVQPCLPFILPPLYLIFGEAFAPYTRWIAYSLGPLNRIATYLLNICMFSCAPMFFCFGIGGYPLSIVGFLQQGSPRIISRNVFIEMATTFFSAFLPHFFAQIATNAVVLLYDLILMPLNWLALRPIQLIACLCAPHLLTFMALSIPFEIPWFILCFPASLILLIFSAPLRIVVSVTAKRLTPLYRVFVTG